MQRGVRFDMCPFGTGAFHRGSEKRSNHLNLNGLDCFGEACFEGPIWTIQIAKSFPCSAALVFFFAEALPCSAALILQLLMFLVVLACWAQRARQKRYEMNGFLMIFHMKGTLGAATKCIPKINISKTRPEKQCFVRLPWELFGSHLG